MNTRFIGIGGLLASMILWSACASTNMQTIERTPDFQSSRIHKVLVVCVIQTPGSRNRFENEFVRQWRARGVEAVASSDVLPVGVTLDKAGIAPFAKTQGFDSVLVTRPLKRGRIQPEFVHPKSEITPPASADSNLTKDVQAVVASPEYGTDFEVVVVGSNLYEVATEKRLWSGITDTLLTGDVPKRARTFAKVILKNIYQPAK